MPFPFFLIGPQAITNFNVSEKSKRRSIKVGNKLWTTKKKRKGHSKINDQIKLNMYTWITHHPQVVQLPISNDSLKVMLDY